MRTIPWLIVAGLATVVIGIFLTSGSRAEGAPAGARKKILVYSESDGFRHSVVARPLDGSLSHAERIFKQILTQAGHEVFLSQSFHDLASEEQFNQYDAIILYTTGNPKINRKALFQWLRSGKALIGVHAAADTFKDDPEFVKCLGAAFLTHGPADKKVTIKVEDPGHPATAMFSEPWVIADEIYQFTGFSRDNVHMLLAIDNSSTDLEAQKMKADEYYPVAWTRHEEKGRVFYTSLGHREDVLEAPLFQKHLLAGIEWAMGLSAGKK